MFFPGQTVGGAFLIFRSERIVWATAWCEWSHHLIRGAGGAGAKDGFLFALELAPQSFSLWGLFQLPMVLVDYARAAVNDTCAKTVVGHSRDLLLALIANLQNTDAAAGMTKELRRKVKLPNAIK